MKTWEIDVEMRFRKTLCRPAMQRRRCRPAYQPRASRASALTCSQKRVSAWPASVCSVAAIPWHWRRHSAANPATLVSGTQIWTGRRPAARILSQRRLTRSALVDLLMPLHVAPAARRQPRHSCHGPGGYPMQSIPGGRAALVGMTPLQMPATSRQPLEIPGRSERIRTSGPCVPNTVLYQAELHSDRGAAYSRHPPPRQAT
jgi:hypothetical protein